MEKTKKEVYLVEGMSCAGCQRAIQGKLRQLEGMVAADTNLSEGTLSVEYDIGTVTAEEIRNAVNTLGYKVVGERPAYGQRESSDEGIA
jgi:copper chaperone CopZ